MPDFTFMPNRPQKKSLKDTIHPAPAETQPDAAKLTAMSKILRKFQPLVNESTGKYDTFVVADGVDVHEVPTRNDCLRAMAEHMPELSKLLKAHGQLMHLYGELYADAMQVHTLLDEMGMNPPSMAEGVGNIVGRHRHALSVISQVAQYGDHKSTDVKLAVAAAVAYQSDIERRMARSEEAAEKTAEKPKPLVNENDAKPQVDSNIVPLPRQDP
jgi:predicted hotdog family 3-hydroxylacyl-ACP dehydratase